MNNVPKETERLRDKRNYGTAEPQQNPKGLQDLVRSSSTTTSAHARGPMAASQND